VAKAYEENMTFGFLCLIERRSRSPKNSKCFPLFETCSILENRERHSFCRWCSPAQTNIDRQASPTYSCSAESPPYRLRLDPGTACVVKETDLMLAASLSNAPETRSL